MKLAIRTKYIHDECILSIGHYPNDRIALVLRTPEDEPVAVLTTNLPNNPMRDDEVAIKDYSENEGVLQCLIDHRLVLPAHRWITSGHVLIPVCQLTTKCLDLAIKAES